MRDLLITKDHKSDCSIVKSSDDKFYSRFIAKYCSILVLLHGETCDRDWFVYQTFSC
jgi:hypothetical protein